MAPFYSLLGFDRNIYGNRDVKILECDYLSVQRCVKLTLVEILTYLYEQVVAKLNLDLMLYCFPVLFH